MPDILTLLDEELIPLIQQDSHPAFTELYNRYKGLLVVHARRKLGGDIEESKEIIQEVFSKIWHSRHQLPKISSLKAYLFTLVRNKVLNHIEHQQIVSKYAASFDDFAQSYQYSSDQRIREKQMMEMIDKEIEALAPKMKMVFLLSRRSHLSHKEIAEQLNISESTVKNHIKAALKILHARLGLILLIIFLRHYS